MKITLDLHPKPAILSGASDDNNNYKNIGASGSFPSVEAGQSENTITDSNATITINNNNNNNTKEITLVAEDAEIEIAPGKRVKAWTFNGTSSRTHYATFRRRKCNNKIHQ